MTITVPNGTVIVKQIYNSKTLKQAKKLQRRNEIMDVAVQVLLEKGYQDTSMLEIARRSCASKETLYRWFKDKQGLFEAIIGRNANCVQSVLRNNLETRTDTESVLRSFGSALLELLLGDEAVAINRAAISQSPSNLSLAKIIVTKGRNETLPLFVDYLAQQINNGVLIQTSPSKAAQDFFGLLVGDKQVQRLLGLEPAPSRLEVERQSLYATKLFLRLYVNKK